MELSAATSTAPTCANRWYCLLQHWGLGRILFSLIETLDGELQLLRWPNGRLRRAARRRSWSRMPLEDPDCDRCLGASDQRRRHHIEGDDRTLGRAGPRGPRHLPARPGQHPGAQLSRDPPGHRTRAFTSPARSGRSALTQYTSPPKGRSAMSMRRYLPPARAAIHDFLSHALPGIPERALADSTSASVTRGCADSTVPLRAPSSAATACVRRISSRGFQQLHQWRRGVDLERVPAAERRSLPRELAELAAAHHGVHGARGG